jgi:hypothetical protein
VAGGGWDGWSRAAYYLSRMSDYGLINPRNYPEVTH